MVLQFSLGRYYGIDSILELMIIVVSVMIAYQSRQIYKIIKDKRYNYFSIAFLSVGISFLFKIISNLSILHRVYIEKFNVFVFIAHELQEMQFIQFTSFILYKVFFLAGFLILFFIATKTENKENIFLYMYLGVIAIIFSIYENYIFQLTVAIILLFLTNYFYHNYKKIRSRNSRLVFYAFLLIFVGHIVMMFESIHPVVYIIDEFLILSGFVVFLVNQYLIKGQNEKKNKVGSNKRSFDSLKRH